MRASSIWSFSCFLCCCSSSCISLSRLRIVFLCLCSHIISFSSLPARLQHTLLSYSYITQYCRSLFFSRICSVLHIKMYLAARACRFVFCNSSLSSLSSSFLQKNIIYFSNNKCLDCQNFIEICVAFLFTSLVMRAMTNHNEMKFLQKALLALSFDMSKMPLVEVRQEVMKARAVSAPGPSGYPYKIYK